VREPICCAVAVLAGLVGATAARADGTFTGVWQGGATAMEVTLESWGKDCGQQPRSSHSEGGGSVHIEQLGQVLVIHGPNRDVRSDQCWSQNLTLRRISTSYADGQWSTRCKTADQDPREELGTYTLKVLAPDQLLYQDVSHYNWKLNASKCVATITTTQTLHRLSAKEAASAPTPIATTQTAKPEAPAAQPQQEQGTRPRCTPGAPVRISLRPHRAEISLGERQCFRARVVDAAGCAIEDAEIKWSLEHGPGIRARLQAGCFEAGESSAESEGTFRVIAAHGPRRAEAEVVVSVESLQTLLAKRLEAGAIADGDEAPKAAEPQTAAPTPPQSSRLAARPLNEREPDSRRWLAGVGALLAALAAALLLSRKSRPRARKSKPTRTRRCPRCNAIYPEGSEFCGTDGSELLPPQ
jgi:hypothetical protein